jgi:hypothetical protein
MKREYLKCEAVKEMSVDEAYEMWNNSRIRLYGGIGFSDWMETMKNILNYRFI